LTAQEEHNCQTSFWAGTCRPKELNAILVERLQKSSVDVGVATKVCDFALLKARGQDEDRQITNEGKKRQEDKAGRP
jgi:hypothetical protein